MNSYILPLLLTGVGGYFLIKLRFFFVLHPIRTAGRGFRAIKDGRALRSFTLALAGTLGVGNVFGVALGLLIGGAGSLFWLFASMIFAMVIKYAEVLITGDNLCHDTDTHGGFFYVIRWSFSRFGSMLSLLYASATLALSLVMGAALQTVAVSESIDEIVDIPRSTLAIALTLIALISIMGGIAKIENITAVMVPLTTIIYIFIITSVIIFKINSLGAAIQDVVSSAFSYRSAAGGGVGFLLAAPVREGFARGILSNEAGAGTSSMAHARSGVISPSSAGILGILEVWFDTGVICMLTGFSILLSVPDLSSFSGGMELIMFSVGSLFGSIGKYVVLFCVFSFALATIICWYYYGSESWGHLFGRHHRWLFLPLFVFFVFMGCFVDSLMLIYVTDVLIALATVLTLSALIKNSDRIVTLSESGGVIDSDICRIRRLRIKGSVFSRGRERR